MTRCEPQPEDCMVVEDSERGRAGATTARLPCLVILSEWTGYGDLLPSVSAITGPQITARCPRWCRSGQR